MAVQTRQRRIANILLLCMFVVAAAFFAYHHESWRDEAQSWLLARDLSPLELFKQMSYEGHPCLWHLLEMPLVRLGLPYYTSHILSIGLVALGMYLLLRRSPLPLWLICAIMFGGGTLYYYGVISRSYCMIPLFLFLIARNYGRRHETPVRYCLGIALLVQTHIIMLAMAAALSLFYMFESIARGKKGLGRKALALCLPLLSAILFALQVANVSNSYYYRIASYSLPDLLRALYESYLRFFSLSWGYERQILGGVVALCGIACLYNAIRNHNTECVKAFLIVGIAMISQLLIDICIYGMSDQRALSMFYIAVWFLWVTWDAASEFSRKSATQMVCAYCILNILFLYNAFTDVRSDFSDSKNCAAFINENISDDAMIFQDETCFAESILPYLENRETFYSVKRGAPESFTNCDRAEAVITTYDGLCEWVRELDPDCDSFYYIHAKVMDLIDGVEANGTVVYDTPDTVNSDERYTIYRCVPIS